jgi:hypothetical protein
MSNVSNVTEVNFRPASENIPVMLRNRADEIETGEPPLMVAFVEYYAGGHVEVFGFGGNLSAGQAYMVLDQGKRKLLDMGI